MAVSPELIEILRCPTCKGDVTLTPTEDSLVCQACAVAYPIVEDIPIMLEERAQPLGESSPEEPGT